MTITPEVAELLLNLRPGDVRISNAPVATGDKVEDRLGFLHNKLIDDSSKMAGNRSWRESLIKSAYQFKELDMLEFYNRLMTEEHDPDVLRVVFLHAQDMGVDPESITTDIVDAYKKITASGYRGYNVVVAMATRDVSDYLIRSVITSTETSLKLIEFIKERGHNNPEALVDFLEAAESSPVPLSKGSL